MASIIILGNGAPQSEQEQLMARIASLPTEVYFVNSAANASSTSILTGIQSAVEKSTEDSLLFVDARVAWRKEQITRMIEIAATSDGKVGVIDVLLQDGNSFQSDSIEAEEVVNLCHPGSRWPSLAAVFTRSFLQDCIQSINIQSAVEVLPKCFVEALARNEELPVLGSIQLDAEQESSAQRAGTLSNGDLSEILRHSINAMNIEDLFPNHNWTEFSGESAAASYHAVCAQFIRLGDYHSALEAVALGDVLEDSPRSLALKGLIAQLQGETLQAVANMVSSLQEYEKRKRDTDTKHYLSFSPNNLDAINGDLRSGLEALNKRDNGSALLHFRSAVFNFDSFYSEMGLKTLSADK